MTMATKLTPQERNAQILLRVLGKVAALSERLWLYQHIPRSPWQQAGVAIRLRRAEEQLSVLRQRALRYQEREEARQLQAVHRAAVDARRAARQAAKAATATSIRKTRSKKQ